MSMHCIWQVAETTTEEGDQKKFSRYTYPAMRKTQGSFSLDIEAGEFTDRRAPAWLDNAYMIPILKSQVIGYPACAVAMVQYSDEVVFTSVLSAHSKLHSQVSLA